MTTSPRRTTKLVAAFVAATLALAACGGGDGGEGGTDITATVVTPSTVAETTVAAETTTTTAASTTTAPESTTTGPDMTTGPAVVIPDGWKKHDPGMGYSIALPPRWVDATPVIKGEVKPEDIPAFENSDLSTEELQQSFGSALELMSLFAVDTKAMTDQFAPNINILQTPLAAEVSPQDVKGQFETQLNQVGEVNESAVITVDGFDAVRTEFTTNPGGLEAVGVQIAVIQPNTLTVITYTGLEVPKNLERILDTIDFQG